MKKIVNIRTCYYDDQCKLELLKSKGLHFFETYLIRRIPDTNKVMSISDRAAIVFYSYSHRDEKFRDSLANHLSILRRKGLIKEWYDRKITGGEEWNEAIDMHLEEADIILLLVSSEFVASDYCWGKEVRKALERHDASKARVIPIIIRPTDWSGAPFRRLQALPKDGKAVTLWSNRDSAWVDISKGIRKVIEELQRSIPVSQTSGARPIIKSTSINESISIGESVVAVTEKEHFMQRPGGKPSRLIYNAHNKIEVPLKTEIARKEGDPPIGDNAVDEVYEWLGVSFDFFWNVYGRNSIDNKGMPLEAIVHYGWNYNASFWNGKQLLFGDGDGKLLNRFTIPVEITAKDYSKGVIRSETQLVYWGQSGALYTSIAYIFASLVKQYYFRQTVDQADWLIGTGLFTYRINGRALRSISQPGSAYDDPDPNVGKDPQVGHMHDYVETSEDNGGIHINSGIPGRAFFLIAMDIGGYAWEKTGRIWYVSTQDKRLESKAEFGDFAKITLANARQLYGNESTEVQAVRKGWTEVGISLEK
jgi:hypothetical protein